MRASARNPSRVPPRHVLEADERVRADDAREPTDALRYHGVALVLHRRRALLSRSERLLHFGHLGTSEMTDLEREAVERRRDDGERAQELRVPVALDDLRRGRRRLEPEPLASDALELRVGCRIRADRPAELPDAYALERARHAPARAVELERPARQLE